MFGPAGSVFDDCPNESQHALVRAAKIARANGQIVAWDCSDRAYSIALWDAEAEQVHPLTDSQAAILLNRDPLICRAWKRWNAASKNRGSLIVLDAEHARHVLREATGDSSEDDEIRGLA